MKAWKEEHCAQRPNELQLIAPDTYIQRRNIAEVQHEANEEAGIEAYTDFKCESRTISVSEYEMIKSINDYGAQAAIDEYTEQLVEEGVL
jgi:DNA polymerase III delta prime subunit